MQLPLTVDRTNVPHWWRVLDASANPVAHCYDEADAYALARAANSVDALIDYVSWQANRGDPSAAALVATLRDATEERP